MFLRFLTEILPIGHADVRRKLGRSRSRYARWSRTLEQRSPPNGFVQRDAKVRSLGSEKYSIPLTPADLLTAPHTHPYAEQVG